jgi:hypothetical protein
MTTVFLTLLLVLGIATQSLAEWTEVHTQPTGDPRLYADYHTIQGTSVWILMDYNTPAYSGSLSTKIQLEFDCPSDRRRITAYATFSGRMATGQSLYVETPSLIALEPFVPVPGGSAAHEIMTHVCPTPDVHF